MGTRWQDHRSRRVLRAMERDARRTDGPAGPERRRSPALPVLGLAAVVAALAFALGARGVGVDLPAGLGELFHQRVYVEVDGEALAVPRPAPASGRLLPEVPVTTGGTYAFLRQDADGAPVGYDPCRPVRWVLRTTGMPDGGEQLVEQAVAEVSAATGLQLEYAGTTDEAPDVDRAIIQPDRYGTDWAPVLVAWATSEEVPALVGDVAGIGGSAAVPGADGAGQWLAAGRLVLDSEDLGAMIAAGQGDSARAIIMHELGHVVGLDHVNSVTELMNPMMSGILDFGPGDRAGLALVGQVDCQ
ncbi:matrixin family metalloprotease [Actinotalea sp. M2MS4P-6]|uniref:matrixin family metalloprotease n=1 Tax=Actinotalea sp. M2MS4P-6 TaxID=2983762 RepID=UPI0021E46316|nr:matrixin family metalloprotease [Actinotalea sp. M2MS4P-6]MCV2393441.1 matrixin family metalloprotease [Actinotalea sp. M2MS4P-6]